MYFKYLSLLILFLPFTALGQTFEVGAWAGGANYQGDMAPDIQLKETNLAGGIFGKRNLSPFFSWRAGINIGSISGNDSNFEHLELRGLSFSSFIGEVSTAFEFNFLPHSMGLNPSPHTPYVFAGISAFIFSPKTTFQNNTFSLRDMGTEGQLADGNKRRYTLGGISIPLGGGYKYTINESWNAAIEVGFRKTFTDYLDDVSTNYYAKEAIAEQHGAIAAALSDRSPGQNMPEGKQRGNKQLKDWYIFGGFILSYRIPDDVCFRF